MATVHRHGGTNLWTDGEVGTDDDAGRRELLVHNGALENFLLAGIEAYASMMVEKDEALKEQSEKDCKGRLRLCHEALQRAWALPS